MRLTKFGKTIRKLRIEYSLSLGSMAKKLEISPSYLSSIEIGERDIPKCFFEKMESLGLFNDKELEEIQSSVDETRKVFNFRPKNDIQRSLIANFARNIDNLTEEQIEVIQAILENSK
jgi:transcriptional regulator with XRE-family HTH domain